MHPLELRVKSIKIGDYVTKPSESLLVSESNFKCGITGLVNMTINIPIKDVVSCLTRFSSKESTLFSPWSYETLNCDVVCLEVTELCAWTIKSDLDALLAGTGSGKILSFLLI